MAPSYPFEEILVICNEWERSLKRISELQKKDDKSQ